MSLKRFPLPFLLIIAVLTSQSSCARLGSEKDAPSTNSSADAQAAIDQILQRYEDAVGGKAAIARIKNYRMKGKFNLAGMTGQIQEWWKEPHKQLAIIEFPKIGRLKKGFDGETSWAQTPAGTVSDSNPQQIAELERDSEVYTAGKIRSLFDSLKLENKARLSGRDVYVLEGKPLRGPAEKLFFDVQNGLLLRWDMALRSPGRTVFVKVHLDDYKDVDGVKVPFTTRFSFESFDFTVQVEELVHNITIDDAMFRKPS